MQTYLDMSRQGKHEWWRSVLAVVLILFMWQIVGAIPSAFLFLMTMLQQESQTGTFAIPSVNSLEGFVAILLESVFFLIGIILAMRFIHRRSVQSLVTPEKRVNLGRILQGFGAWFILAAIMSIVEALLYPGRYQFTLDTSRLLPFAVLALVFIPIQTTTEELFFRGYILQGVGMRQRNIWLLCSISGILFGLPHLLNPEASVNYPVLLLYYVAFGFFLAYITLRDGKLELALGAHAANNLFAVLIANSTVSVLPSPSIFTIQGLDAVYSTVSAILGMLVFIWLFTGPMRRKREDPLQ
jgi:membrane protease YdiL (CAAX protease family)